MTYYVTTRRLFFVENRTRKCDRDAFWRTNSRVGCGKQSFAKKMVLLVLCWVVTAGLCAWGFALEVANLTTGLARNDVDVTYWLKQWQLICNCALRVQENVSVRTKSRDRDEDVQFDRGKKPHGKTLRQEKECILQRKKCEITIISTARPTRGFPWDHAEDLEAGRYNHISLILSCMR